MLYSDPNYQQGYPKEIEQTIVKWQLDEEAIACPHCSSSFSMILRKHHCRLCGLVICIGCS
ncbi:carboxypeptidase Y-deficient, partial [Coelomomyces lativittatus]